MSITDPKGQDNTYFIVTTKCSIKGYFTLNCMAIFPMYVLVKHFWLNQMFWLSLTDAE